MSSDYEQGVHEVTHLRFASGGRSFYYGTHFTDEDAEA